MMTERKIFLGLLVIIASFVIGDLATDSPAQLKGLHLIIEVAIGILSLSGIAYFAWMFLAVERKLQVSEKNIRSLNIENTRWKTEAQKLIEGMAKSIDDQFDRWQLTKSEKEVALLFLKGLSIKEIASLREVGEKTIHAQATSIYSKSGLGGRSELAAFFLEDLLSPALE